ncbi:LLM class F420-dependent oxidoreductase [Litorivivens sp.]|uniref:LLM class F420-dependent oxidoreductase n=1 Tax=Litorivivens sp. TaxID=2020868 RepID=UPI00356779B2
MDFWQVISWCETEQIPAIAMHAEQLGFKGLILAEHIYYPAKTRSRYYYSADGVSPQTPDMEFPDPLISFAAAAAVTRTLEFMTGIYVVPLRHPVELAKNIATLSRLSDNRFSLGLGSGWLKEEFDQFGVDFSRRGRRTDAMLEVMRQLWRGAEVSYADEFFTLDRVKIRPIPSQSVPLVGGGHSPAALRRAVELCDGWYGPGNTLEDLETLVPNLLAMRKASPRREEPFQIVAPLLEPLTPEAVARLSAMGVSGTVNYPFLFGIGPEATLDDKKRYMDSFARKLLT